MTDQEQKVSRGGTGYQASRDVVVNKGMSSEQMSEIMVALAGQLSEFIAGAKETQEQRFKEFRDSLLKEFAKTERVEGRSSFAEPDFQYVVREAHETFARSGDPDLKEQLVSLVGERANKDTGSRVAKILNTSIQLAGRLSREEYSALGTIFFLQSVAVVVPDKEAILQKYNHSLTALAESLPKDAAATEYLGTLGCVNINYVMTQSLGTILSSKYGHIFGEGFTSQEFMDAADGATIPPLPGLLFQVGGSDQFYFRPGSENDIKLQLDRMVADPALANKLIDLRKKVASEHEVVTAFRATIPAYQKVEDFWKNSAADKTHITMIGKALAHSALTSRGIISAPIEIWIN